MNSFTILNNQTYVNEYVQLLYRYYIHTQPSVFGVYYNIDKDNSVYDENIRTDYGTTGSNILSGIKFKAYYYMPIIFSEYTQRQDTNDQQHGYNSQINVRFNVSIPSFDNIDPNPNDVIKFTTLEGEEKLFRVMNIERANITVNDSLHNMYRLYLEPYYVTFDQIEQQVITRYGFLQNKNKFVDIDIFNTVMDIMDILNLIKKSILLSYNTHTDSYVENFLKSINYKNLNSIFTIFDDQIYSEFSFVSFLKIYKHYDTEFSYNEIYDLIDNIDLYYTDDNDIVRRLTNGLYNNLQDIFNVDINDTNFLLIKEQLSNNTIQQIDKYNYTLECLLHLFTVMNYYKNNIQDIVNSI